MTKSELNTIAKEEALPCPFCGATPTLEETRVYKREYVISCPRCGNVTIKEHALKPLLAKWNTRYHAGYVMLSKADMRVLRSSLNGLCEPLIDKVNFIKGILTGVVNWVDEKCNE